MHRRTLAPAAALAVSALVAVGCTSGEPEPGSRTGTAPVVQLGAPGEGNRVLDPGEVEDLAGATPEASEADIAFVRDMVPHHQQALAMTALAERNGAGRAVRLLAERMGVSQTDEVAQLQQWLEDQGPLPPDDHGRHGGDQAALMPGMLTDAQMSALATARGLEFDRRFLTSMIAHHQGALAMVEDLLSRPDGGRDVWVGQFARGVDSDQRIEIARMTSVLQSL
ncbi:MAG TPA: DUF305 domain-containing protein [Ornithinibacter sp.]|nr:DUF305 domain-containing protein [Ornithinibacter sp.]